MISVHGLTFDYPGVRALDNVSFQIPAGNITALVGPNGAGKTTLLRCLAALEEPLSGSIRINGVDALAEPRRCHRQMGYLSDFFGLYEGLTVMQCLLHASALNGQEPDTQERAGLRAAERLGLTDRLEAPARTLSRGLRQRLAIAQAIVHEPRVLLLDEPASGLDPEARHLLANLFLQLRNDGMTLLVSSHILAELEEYSTDMLVLRQGRIISHETVQSGQRKDSRTRLTISLVRPAAGLQELLAGFGNVHDIKTEDSGRHISFGYEDDAAAQYNLVRYLVENNVPVCSFGPERRSMQDAYMATVSGQQRGAE